MGLGHLGKSGFYLNIFFTFFLALDSIAVARFNTAALDGQLDGCAVCRNVR
jgi:hypothetical protein